MANNNGVGGTTSNRQPGGVFDNQSVADARGIIPQGTPGATGPAGPQGPAGPMGTPGTNGRNGANGMNGADGRSIDTITDARTTTGGTNMDESGNILTITYTGGTTPRAPDTVFLPDGVNGMDGRGIRSITGSTAAAGQPTTITVTFTDNTTMDFTVAPGADGMNGMNGMDGATGDSYRQLTLYQVATGFPAPPGNTEGFDPATGRAVTAGDWAPFVTSTPGAGERVFIVEGVVRDVGTTGAWTATLSFNVNGTDQLWSGSEIISGPAGATGADGSSVSNLQVSRDGTSSNYEITYNIGTDSFTTNPFVIPAGATYTPTSPDDTIMISGADSSVLQVRNPFTDDDETKLDDIDIRDVNIVAGAVQADGSQTFTWTRTATDGTPRVIAWTTGGGTNPGPVESFTATLNPASVNVVGSGAGETVTLTLGVSGEGFTYNGYQNLRFPAGVTTTSPTNGTSTNNVITFNIPNDMVRNFEIDVDILSVQTNPTPGGRPITVNPHPIVRTFRVTAAPAPARDVFIGWAQEATQGQTTLDYNTLNTTETGAGNTMILAQAGQMVPIPAPPSTDVNDLILMYPRDANIHFSLIGRIEPDQGNITINNVPGPRTGYIGIRINDRRDTTTYTIAPGV